MSRQTILGKRRQWRRSEMWPWLMLLEGSKWEPPIPMFRAIQHNCTRSYKWTIAALGMRVERSADVVCLNEPPRERKGFEIRHTASEIRKWTRGWTAVPKGCGLAVDEQIHMTQGGNDDVIVTDVLTRGEKVTRIVNVNIEQDTKSRERPAQKLRWQRSIWKGRTVLAGDCNAHTRWWHPKYTEQWDTVFWEDVLDKNKLEFGREDQAPHNGNREYFKGKSIIDLTLGNRPVRK